MVDVDAVIGEGAIVTTNTTVDYDASLGVFAHLGVGVPLAGGVKSGARAWPAPTWSGCWLFIKRQIIPGGGAPLVFEVLRIEVLLC